MYERFGSMHQQYQPQGKASPARWKGCADAAGRAGCSRLQRVLHLKSCSLANETFVVQEKRWELLEQAARQVVGTWPANGWMSLLFWPCQSVLMVLFHPKDHCSL